MKAEVLYVLTLLAVLKNVKWAHFIFHIYLTPGEYIHDIQPHFRIQRNNTFHGGAILGIAKTSNQTFFLVEKNCSKYDSEIGIWVAYLENTNKISIIFLFISNIVWPFKNLLLKNICQSISTKAHFKRIHALSNFLVFLL